MLNEDCSLLYKLIFAVPGQIFSSNAKGPNQLIKQGAILIQHSGDVLKELGIESLGKTQEQMLYAENPEEALVFQALQEESLYIDQIIEKTKLSAPSVATALAMMEISGKIRNLGGNMYSLK